VGLPFAVAAADGAGGVPPGVPRAAPGDAAGGPAGAAACVAPGLAAGIPADGAPGLPVTGNGPRDGTVAAPGRGGRIRTLGRLARREMFPWLT